jgi:acetoacetyl-CoA synthetase
MKVEAWQQYQTPVYGEAADLVCTQPFPCQPVYFWNDHDLNKYKSAYFDMYKGVWYHGDFIWINPTTLGLVMLGRSDGTLNPGGVRFGSAELYNIVQVYVQVMDALAVGQITANQEERVILFLKMQPDHTLDDALISQLTKDIRTRLSPRHVPARILPTPDIPYTVNGKKVEIAVKRILSNQPYTPSGTLINPQSLDYFKQLEII